MLVGTFQGIPDASHRWIAAARAGFSVTSEGERTDSDRLALRIIEDHDRGREEFGFSPVWVFPIPTLADAFAHGAMSRPFSAMFFVVYDVPEEDLIKIDARERANRHGALDDWQSMVTDSDDVSIIEYVVDESKLDGCERWTYWPFEVRKVSRDLPSPVDPGSRSFLDAYMRVNAPLFAFYDLVKEVRPQGDVFSYPVLDGGEGNLDVAFQSQWYKDQFLIARLPFVYAHVQSSLSSEPFAFNTARFVSVSRDMDRFRQLLESFALASIDSEPISLAEWKGIYDGFKGMVCDDLDVLTALYEGREPGRNDPCPCGSGKKWKQCHGRLNHQVRCKPFCQS